MTVGPAQTLLEAAALVEARQPFVLVTVVWRRGPTSGRAGHKAIVLADGTVRGWVSGACAAPTVVERAVELLSTGGGPESMVLGRGADVDRRLGDGESVPMACESDGALEVCMEPMIPPVRLIVIGRSPAVDALASMGLALGWDARIVDDGGDPDQHELPGIVHTKLELDHLAPDRATAVIVATQGHYDDLALRAALATPAGHIGLVASAMRAAALLDQLEDDGVAEARTRVTAPAGIDLGSIDNVEIAASVIADLVARRARGELAATAPTEAARPTATDPICGMTVHPDDAKYHSLHDGVDYWFCASGCKRAFDADPHAALNS